MSQSSSVPPASFSLALKSPLTAVACGEEKDIFLPRDEGEEMVGEGGGQRQNRGGGRRWWRKRRRRWSGDMVQAV